MVKEWVVVVDVDVVVVVVVVVVFCLTEKTKMNVRRKIKSVVRFYGSFNEPGRHEKQAMKRSNPKSRNGHSVNDDRQVEFNSLRLPRVVAVTIAVVAHDSKRLAR